MKPTRLIETFVVAFFFVPHHATVPDQIIPPHVPVGVYKSFVSPISYNPSEAFVGAVVAEKAREAKLAQEAAEQAQADAEAAQLKEQAVTPAPSIQSSVTTVTPVYQSSCGDPKSCIYSHESGNDPTKYNPSGCLGLGQACPASKLLVVCPTVDYACEDAWFTNYMVANYGTWDNAWAVWQSKGWW